MKKILIIGVNKKDHTIRRLHQELRRLKIKSDFISWKDLAFGSYTLINDAKVIDVSKYKAAFLDSPCYSVLKKGKKLFFDLTNELHFLTAFLLEKNVPVINGKIFINYPYHDKFNQSQIFALENIPTIPTTHFVDNSVEQISRKLDILGLRYPLVIKESNTGMGRGVYRVNDLVELGSLLKNRRDKNLIFQPYIENDCDYRIIVCGGKSLGIMKRTAAKGNWKNNFSLGGHIEKYTESTMERFSESVCKKIGLDLAGIDVFKTGEQAYQIIEINLFPGFEGFEKVHPGVNIAREIVIFLKSNS
jgi:RimK family alpha-L-glutamate ligase